MSDPLLSFVAGMVASVTAILLIAVVLRVRPTWPPVYVFASGIALSGLTAMLVGSAWLDRFHLWAALAAAGAIGIANFFTFSAVYKSISLRMLVLLASQPGGRTDKNVLVESIVRPAVTSRMDLLVEMGMAEALGSTYAATAKGRRTITRLRSLQRLFGISRSGLYRKPIGGRQG